MKFDILKCHGSGNDFILIDERKLSRLFGKDERQNIALTLCDHETGIGADGILFVQDDLPNDGKMVIYNADGSEASMCGNGLRCVVRVVAESSGKQILKIATKGGVYTCMVIDDFYEKMPGYSIEIDTIDFDSSKMIETEEMPSYSQPLNFLFANVPNPHVVASVNPPDTNLLKEVGTHCNAPQSPFFDGVNVNFFTPVGKDALFVETFERGVGLTNACGTGMVAASLIANQLGVISSDKWIDVFNKGGFVRTKISRDDHQKYKVSLLGNATYEFAGQVEYDFEARAYTFTKKEYFLEEIRRYKAVVKYAKRVVENSSTIL